MTTEPPPQSPRWNLDETRHLVRRLYGRRQVDALRPCLRSIFDRQEYARFHYHGTVDLLNEFVAARLANASLLDVIFSDDDETADAFQVFITQIGAHFVGCVQSLHAIADILSHAIYFALALDRVAKPLAAQDVCASTVLARLQSAPDAARVHALFNELCNGGRFDHLAALVNHSKHRSIVQPSISEDWTGAAPQRHTLKVQGFVRETRRTGSKTFPEMGMKEFLQPEFDRCSALVVHIGIALNEVLRSRMNDGTGAS